MVKSEVLEAFKEFDSPTIFNAIVLSAACPTKSTPTTEFTICCRNWVRSSAMQ